MSIVYVLGAVVCDLLGISIREFLSLPRSPSVASRTLLWVALLGRRCFLCQTLALEYLEDFMNLEAPRNEVSVKRGHTLLTHFQGKSVFLEPQEAHRKLALAPGGASMLVLGSAEACSQANDSNSSCYCPNLGSNFQYSQKSPFRHPSQTKKQQGPILRIH